MANRTRLLRCLIGTCLLLLARASADVDFRQNAGSKPVLRLSQETVPGIRTLAVDVECRNDGTSAFRIGPFDRSRPINFEFLPGPDGLCPQRKD